MSSMETCTVEVEINGVEIFYVDKNVLATHSARLSKLFSEFSDRKNSLKVIFLDFPGGAEGFELVARFCYTGKINISTSNVVLLNCCAHYMEMERNVNGTISLIHETDKFLQGISFWSWSELMVALKQTQDLLPSMNSTLMFQKLHDGVVKRFVSPFAASTCSSSPERFSSSRVSCETRSMDSMRNRSFQCRLFEDLAFLHVHLIEKFIGTMISQKIDHFTISLFIFYYRKSKILGASQSEKVKIIEVVISMLFLLDKRTFSSKGLFDILQVAISLDIRNPCKSKLESMLGSQLDRATLDHLLVRAPSAKNCMYDVNFVLRLIKAFLLEESCSLPPKRLKKIASLVDSYLAEVAPDIHLKPSKFVQLVKVLPNSARQSHDKIYNAMDMYLKVHAGISEADKRRICYSLNVEKLSEIVLNDLASNLIFPSKIVLKALRISQSRLGTLHQDAYLVETINSILTCKTTKGNSVKKTNTKNVLYVETLDCITAVQLNKVAGIMPLSNQIEDILQSKLCLPKYVKSFSKLCS